MPSGPFGLLRRGYAAGFNAEKSEYEDAETLVFKVGGGFLQTNLFWRGR